ncbi:hypothetical protein M422DRAFT_243932 [Sphaerobolus stellatus SS14]|nr:hypothetical protein M422DRAFT_243932 [Sphaerobolus stellatus SS14]
MDLILPQLPADVLDTIAFQLDHPKDLVSLARTCRKFFEIVHPKHLYYRRISCDPRRESIWKGLISHRGIAERFARLSLFDETRPKAPFDERKLYRLLPLSFKTDQNVANKKAEPKSDASRPYLSLLPDVIANFSNLVRFSWVCPNFTVAEHNILPEMLVMMTGSCPALKEIELELDAHGTSHSSISENELDLPLPIFPQVTQFILRYFSRTIAPPLIPFLVRVVKTGCPTIIDLNFTIMTQPKFDVTPLFENAHWSSLKRLKIQGAFPDPIPDSLPHTLSLFFNNHPNLHSISLLEAIPPPGSFSDEALPLLRSLTCMADHYARSAPKLILPASLADQLTSIRSINVKNFFTLFPFLPNLRVLASSIEDVDLPLVLRAAPHLEKLANNCLLANPGSLALNLRLETLVRFQNVTHISGFILVLQVKSIPKNPQNDLVFLTKSHSIKYIRVTDWGWHRRTDMKWCEVVRDKHGQFVKFKVLTGPMVEKKQLDMEYWTNDFTYLGK